MRNVIIEDMIETTKKQLEESKKVTEYYQEVLTLLEKELLSSEENSIEHFVNKQKKNNRNVMLTDGENSYILLPHVDTAANEVVVKKWLTTVMDLIIRHDCKTLVVTKEGTDKSCEDYRYNKLFPTQYTLYHGANEIMSYVRELKFNF